MVEKKNSVSHNSEELFSESKNPCNSSSVCYDSIFVRKLKIKAKSNSNIYIKIYFFQYNSLGRTKTFLKSN